MQKGMQRVSYVTHPGRPALQKGNKEPSGSGLRPKGLRTSAKKKALKERIARKREEGKPLNRRERQKARAMDRVTKDLRKQKTEAKAEERKEAIKYHGFKQDVNGKWRDSSGHFLAKDVRDYYQLD